MMTFLLRCLLKMVHSGAGQHESGAEAFGGCLLLPAIRVPAQNDQRVFDLLVRMQFSQEPMVVLQAVQV